MSGQIFVNFVLTFAFCMTNNLNTEESGKYSSISGLCSVCLGMQTGGHLPLFGDILAFPHPWALEVVAELVPQHEDVIGCHLLFTWLGLQTKVIHQVLEPVEDWEMGQWGQRESWSFTFKALSSKRRKTWNKTPLVNYGLQKLFNQSQRVWERGRNSQRILISESNWNQGQ